MRSAIVGAWELGCSATITNDVGEPVNAYVRRVRMERAARQLLYSD